MEVYFTTSRVVYYLIVVPHAFVTFNEFDWLPVVYGPSIFQELWKNQKIYHGLRGDLLVALPIFSAPFSTQERLLRLVSAPFVVRLSPVPLPKECFHSCGAP